MTSQHTTQGKTTRSTQVPKTPSPTQAPATQSHPMLHLQRQVGNQAATSIVQAKLTVGEPNDAYEQEADRIAAQVVRQIHAPVQSTAQRKPQTNSTPQIQSLVQCKGGTGGMEVSSDVEAGIQQARGAGQPLPEGLRSSMEQAFGADFSGVRIHTGGESDRLNRAVQAKAFTTEQNIFFSQGAYNPSNPRGQELLAHELTHVVQQSGGTKGPNIQRKVFFLGYENSINAGLGLFFDIKFAIIKHKGTLKEHFPQEIEYIENELIELDKIKQVVEDMNKSLCDYGEINVNNGQHVVLFVKDALIYSKKDEKYKNKQEEEQHIRRRAAKEQEFWLQQKQKSPGKGANTYGIALLGTGVSIANYVNVHRQELDPQETIIIGEQQPWDPSNPKGRAITFTNHPPSMSSPVRNKTQLAQEKSGIDETFEGNAQKLTDDINKVLQPFSHRVDDTIKQGGISKVSTWYKIETENCGIYFAKNIVAGLGIGPHQRPKNQRQAEILESHKQEEKKRVMDLNTFQWQLKDKNSPIRKQFEAQKQQLTIGLSGPNAGVDAASTATELGMEVLWLVSGDGPALAEGMGNAIKRKDLVTLYFDYLDGWIIEGEKVKLAIQGKWKTTQSTYKEPKEQRKNCGEEFLKKNEGWKTSENQEESVDYLVYATGPDVEKVWSVFDSSVTQNLTLIYDDQRRFSSLSSTQESPLVSMKFSDSLIRKQIKEKVGFVLAKENIAPDLLDSISLDLKSKAQKILGVDDFEGITSPKDVVIGLGSENGSFQIIGGAAIRTLEYLDGLNRYDNNLTADENIKRLNKVPGDLRGSNKKNASAMKNVLETLSSPTILMNDQLTPIRSQIEAQGNYIPGYIGMEESNFVTDDQTMIAAQIASHYDNIPPALANWVTQAIIQDRHKNGVKPGTNQGSRAFVDKWNDKLEKLDNLFSYDNIEQSAKASLLKRRS